MAPGCRRQLAGGVLIYKNVKGYTLAADSLVRFEALAVQHGRVLDYGKYDSLKKAFPWAVEVDGGNHALLPGFTDAHGHVMGLGYSRLHVDLVNIASLDKMVDKVAGYAKENPKSAWIVGRGWNQVLWPENRFPTAADLDKAVPDRPVFLRRVDGHAAVANTQALRNAGITDQTPDPQGGKIMRDAQGHATGLLIDHAMQLVEKHVPPPTDDDMARALEKSLAELRSFGITSVHDAGVDSRTWELYKRFAQEGKLSTRIYAMIGGVGAEFDKLSANGPIDTLYNDRLSLRAVKLYADGALGSRGAALLQPYTDDPKNNGLLFYPPDTLHAMMAKAAGKGYQVCVHAIGDRANRVALDGFEKLNKQKPIAAARHRIEHAQVVAPADFKRFAELGVIASVQPTHATSDMNMAEARLGPQRVKGAYAWRTFVENGVVVCSGSDFPVESANPLLGLQASVWRRDTTGKPKQGWYTEQALSRQEAFRAFTQHAAYAAHQEKVLGTLEKGKWADFVLVEHDPIVIGPNHIAQLRVLETWVAGRNVYQLPR
jgi:predicted amidohydrolase YtcJ